VITDKEHEEGRGRAVAARMIGVDPATLRRALNGLDDPGGSSAREKFQATVREKNGPVVGIQVGCAGVAAQANPRPSLSGKGTVAVSAKLNRGCHFKFKGSSDARRPRPDRPFGHVRTRPRR
jgi:hypothetical protein